MTAIKKAFHTLEKVEMTVSEYDNYLKKHKSHNSICAIRCVECGDLLTYCKGDINTPYFKHSPTHEGHGYCSLYKEGQESKTHEGMVRKKLFKEEDVSFNFELLLRGGEWKSLLTMPPFTSKEIELNENNETIILIESGNENICLKLDSNHFQSGEIKRIGIRGFPENIKFTISGKTSKNDISYKMRGFYPSNQLYSSMIKQTYSASSSGISIDLNRIKEFTCKRISGKVFTGRHYIIFSKLPSLEASMLGLTSTIIKRIELKRTQAFLYYAYDVVFTKLTEENYSFCAMRNCELVEHTDAVILWPPVKTIGNYRYYDSRSTTMFLCFESSKEVMDLTSYKIVSGNENVPKIFFKIQNPNSCSFYVMLDKRKRNIKNKAIISTIDDSGIIEKYRNTFVIVDGALFYKDNDKKILNKATKLVFDDLLNRYYVIQQSVEREQDYEILKDTIIYSRSYINFDKKYLKYLEEKFKGDEFVQLYLQRCEIVGTIKEKALRMMLDED